MWDSTDPSSFPLLDKDSDASRDFDFLLMTSDDQTLHCHKLFLTYHSRVFKHCLEAGSIKKNGDGVEYLQVEAQLAEITPLLQFIYHIEELSIFQGQPIKGSPLQLALSAAAKYDVPQLFEYIDKFLQHYMNSRLQPIPCASSYNDLAQSLERRRAQVLEGPKESSSRPLRTSAASRKAELRAEVAQLSALLGSLLLQNIDFLNQELYPLLLVTAQHDQQLAMPARICELLGCAFLSNVCGRSQHYCCSVCSRVLVVSGMEDYACIFCEHCGERQAPVCAAQSFVHAIQELGSASLLQAYFGKVVG